jgi:hypothetical protein
VTIGYGDLYHSKGFDSTANSGQVWAKVLVTGDPKGVLQHTTIRQCPCHSCASARAPEYQ